VPSPNVERTYRAWEALNRQDFTAVMELMHPDIA
jgi:ketosteroid isomerase-like protein